MIFSQLKRAHLLELNSEDDSLEFSSENNQVYKGHFIMSRMSHVGSNEQGTMILFVQLLYHCVMQERSCRITVR